MVTYFNKKDLVDFGTYLLSEARTDSVLDGINEVSLDPKKDDYLEIAKQRLRRVSRTDLENFLETIKKTH